MSAALLVPLLFIYGSLRVGSANPHAPFLHRRCRHAGTGRMPGRLFRNGSLHGALYEPESASRVIGDIFELPEETAAEMLTSLDRYEGIGAGVPAPASFKRELVGVHLPDGTPLKCWAWLYTQPLKGFSHIRHGDVLTRE
jgi:gamma-glutamylcyclotransferase (GGCT)/AIG2-like uncharacterized protein YtfP